MSPRPPARLRRRPASPSAAICAQVHLCFRGRRFKSTFFVHSTSKKPLEATARGCCATTQALLHLRRERDYDDMDEEDPFNPRARRGGPQNPALANMHSFCSYSSSAGSQSSLQPPAPAPAPAVSHAPVSDYT